MHLLFEFIAANEAVIHPIFLALARKARGVCGDALGFGEPLGNVIEEGLLPRPARAGHYNQQRLSLT